MSVIQNSWVRLFQEAWKQSSVHDWGLWIMELISNSSDRQRNDTSKFCLCSSLSHTSAGPCSAALVSVHRTACWFLSAPVPSLWAIWPPSFFFFLRLISSIKALLSGLCQGGMLTTPGIATLREFTSSSFLSPPPPPLFLLFALCVFFNYQSLQPVSLLLFDTTAVFSLWHKAVCSLPPLYCSVSGTRWHRLWGEFPGLSTLNLTVSRTLQPSTASRLLRVFFSEILEMFYFWILKTEGFKFFGTSKQKIFLVS